MQVKNVQVKTASFDQDFLFIKLRVESIFFEPKTKLIKSNAVKPKKCKKSREMILKLLYTTVST